MEAKNKYKKLKRLFILHLLARFSQQQPGFLYVVRHDFL